MDIVYLNFKKELHRIPYEEVLKNLEEEFLIGSKGRVFCVRVEDQLSKPSEVRSRVSAESVLITL